MPTQKQIENAFIIAECGSFSKASERLFISASALIQQINLLENEIGFSLFVRTKKGVRLTKAGHYYLSELKQISARVDHITEAAREMADNKGSTFRIGYLTGQSPKKAMDISCDLLTAYPNLSVKLSPVMTHRVREELLSGRIDCCILPQQIYDDSDRLDGFIISRTPLMIGIHPELELARREWITFPDLQNQRIVLPARGIFETSDLFEAQLLQRDIPFERITQDDHIAAEMTCLSERACRINGTVVDGSPLVYRPLREDLTFNLLLIYRRDSHAAFREYLEAIRAHVGAVRDR